MSQATYPLLKRRRPFGNGTMTTRFHASEMHHVCRELARSRSASIRQTCLSITSTESLITKLLDSCCPKVTDNTTYARPLMECQPLGSVPSPLTLTLKSPVALHLPSRCRAHPAKLSGFSRHCGVTRSLKRLSAVAAGQVRRQQREEASAQQQAGPDVLRQPSAGEAAGQRLAAFLRAASPAAPAARLEHGADRPLPVQPADLHDRRQPPVRRVRGGGGDQLTGLLMCGRSYRAGASRTLKISW